MYLELEVTWMACMLGHRTQELDHGPLSVRCAIGLYSNESVMGSHRLHLKGSYLDGGANHPYADPASSFLESVRLTRVCRLQLAAIPLLDPDHVAHERVGFLQVSSLSDSHRGTACL